jgi:hypothetical protein
MFKERCHLNAELDARVGHSRYVPDVCMVSVPLAEHLLQGSQIVLDRAIVLPPQKQHRNAGVMRFLCLPVYVHGSILEVPGKGLEVAPLRRRGYRFLGNEWVRMLQLLQSVFGQVTTRHEFRRGTCLLLRKCLSGWLRLRGKLWLGRCVRDFRSESPPLRGWLHDDDTSSKTLDDGLLR